MSGIPPIAAGPVIDPRPAITGGESCQCLPLVPEPPVPDCVVQFDYNRWNIRFPEFAPYVAPLPGADLPTTPEGLVPNPVGVSPELAQELFYDATLFLDNSCHSPVCDASKGGERERLLFLLTAHLAFLRGGPNAPGGGAGSVGRVTSKSVGPVSVGFGGATLGANAAWFEQTQYGLAFWQAVGAYRLFRYRAGPWFRGYGWRSGAWVGSGNPLPFSQSIAR